MQLAVTERAPRATGAPATASDTHVSFVGVQKTYDGEVIVVDDLNLDVRRGEFLSLLGASGSGKTTTLMMLAGFESPTAGEILLGGSSITRIPPHKRNFGMVFQNYALFPHMTVAENVAYPLTARRRPKAEIAAKVESALAMVQLHGRSAAYPRQLSGGQQQRVALARALVFEPQLVLMDEPLGALDKQLREHMQLELKELHRQLGITFVYVTHDQAEALTMSDRVAVFNDGRIQQIDSVSALYETPTNRFVAGFVGDSTTLHGTVARCQGATCEIVLRSGERLHGANVNGAAPGAQVVASVRPERVVAHFGEPPAAENALRCVMKDVIYHGDHLRLRCELHGQPEATVKLALSQDAPPAAGQPVWLAFPREHLRIYA